MVTFQNKIIYMPGLPPNARWEKISDYASRCGGLQWREERVRAVDGTDLALCVTDVELGRNPASERPEVAFYILYFQGRPNEKGLRLDAAAALGWISQLHRESYGSEPPAAAQSGQVMLWGQSIGSGVATNLAAEQLMPVNLRLNSLILETPFTSIRAMLEVLYPQNWLPYKYLWPFLRNQLDSWTNLGIISERYKEPEAQPAILLLEAAKDELVPAKLSQELYNRCLKVNIPVERVSVAGAFHNDAMFRAEGRKAVANFIKHQIAAV
ncbi:hypothetical protein SLS62_003040 [Diatrype stigma]|uniref:Uncharacterized protein n=1 Tax=Diatrype stigma TaxID=117547 RepID=A0AAN9YRR0_9PEZI